MIADNVEATVESGFVAFTITMIVGGPRIEAGQLAGILEAVSCLLAEIELRHTGGSAAEWGVSGVLVGHSEYSGIQRLAVDLAAVEPSGEVLPGLFSLMAGLCTVLAPPERIPSAILELVAELAVPVAAGTIREMWLSQPGETPVYVTEETLRNARELLGLLANG